MASVSSSESDLWARAVPLERERRLFLLEENEVMKNLILLTSAILLAAFPAAAEVLQMELSIFGMD